MNNATTGFAVRIVGHEEVAPDQLLANPLNFRVHSKEQQKTMEEALKRLGWLDEIIVNHRTGHVLNGHMRVNIAMRNNEATVPVKYVDLSLEEEQLALATFDPIGNLATHDKEMLEALVSETETDSQVLEQFLSRLLPAHSESYEPAEDQEDELGDGKYMILIDCESEAHQVELLEQFTADGLECRALST